MLWRVVVDGVWELDAGVFLADGRPRGRAGRLALASPGRESSFGGLNYVVSYTEFADKTFRSVRGQKVAQHHKVINSSIHGQDNRTDQNEVRRRTSSIASIGCDRWRCARSVRTRQLGPHER